MVKLSSHPAFLQHQRQLNGFAIIVSASMSSWINFVKYEFNKIENKKTFSKNSLAMPDKFSIRI
jgi:hypothetical protein